MQNQEKWWQRALNVVVYFLAPAIMVAILLSAVPALLNKPSLTKTLGWTGFVVGGLLGLWFRQWQRSRNL